MELYKSIYISLESSNYKSEVDFYNKIYTVSKRAKAKNNLEKYLKTLKRIQML